MQVNSIVLAIVRFCSGFGIGGSVPLVFSLTSEFVAPLHRGNRAISGQTTPSGQQHRRAKQHRRANNTVGPPTPVLVFRPNPITLLANSL